MRRRAAYRSASGSLMRCGDGVYRDSMILVTGATGSGTTLLGAQFAKAGLDAGERVLLLSFEGRTSRRRAMSARGGSISRRRYGRLVSRYAERMGLEDLLVQIEHEFEQSGARRVVFDSMTALEHNAPARAFGEFGVGLSGFLMARSVAGLVTTTSDSLLGGVSVAGVALSRSSAARRHALSRNRP